MKKIRIFIRKLRVFLVVKFSIYLNRRVFIMATNERIIIWTVLGLEKEECVLLLLLLPYMGMIIDGAWSFEQLHQQDRHEILWILAKWLLKRLFNNIRIFYMYTAQRQWKVNLAEYNFDCLKAFATSIIYCKFETLQLVLSLCVCVHCSQGSFFL